jgi:hypothetical protein
MNTEVVVGKLDGAVASLIDKVLAGVDTGVGFMEGQLPEYVIQLLMWHGVFNFLMCIVAFVVPFVLYKVTMFLGQKDEKDEWKYTDPDGDPTPVFVFGFFATCIGAFTFFVSINVVWLQIWIAPKVWLVEYAANLIK